ncbi:MAG: VapC toxin family PIN domain ribonuclease [Candidatus Hydrogenedentes bacterium]|nr:VapC toxin family PIN domain ribonuclease [Candidatus Hydrogenedentota bacterium]
MSVALLDVNVLLALAWPSHVHNRYARTWFKSHRSAQWATCPLTQCAFIRISSNPKILAEACDPADAIALLRRFTSLDNHVFWSDAVPLTAPAVPAELLVGHRQVVDAYLLGLASHFGGKFVTFDRAVSALVPTDSPHQQILEVLLPG